MFILLRIKPITCYSYTNIRKTYSRFRNKKITHDFDASKSNNIHYNYNICHIIQ